MSEVTYSELRELIAVHVSGSAPVGILAVTDTRSRKTGNPFGKVFKTIRAVGWVGASYARGVNRELSRQGVEGPTFESQALPWGEWDIPGKVITHKGSLYLRTQATPGMRRKSPARVLGYRAENGTEVSREQVAPFLPVASGSAKQSEAGMSSDPKEQIWVGTYAFSSLRKVRIAGKTYTVAH
jgi:hypothetical protein